jgi:trehalose/maltose hydrolase-like predicted phosphorylase
VKASDLLFSSDGDPSWLLIEEGIDVAREREIESIFALANGYLGTRASLAEDGTLSNPATFVAGIYVADEASGLGPRLAALPNWGHLEVAVEGVPLSLKSGRAIEHRRWLDLHQGILWREWKQQDPSGRITRLTFLRFASLADRHVLIRSVVVTPENYTGLIKIIAGPGPLGGGADAKPVVVGSAEILLRASETQIALVGASEFRAEKNLSSSLKHECNSEGGSEAWSWNAGVGDTARLDRIVGVFTSRDAPKPAETATDHFTAIRTRGFPVIVRAHVEAWSQKWEAADIQIVGDEKAQRAIRFAIYHLISAGNPTDEHVSIAARGLTGEGYRGHVFWDTEIYMMPFYLFSDPSAARALLMYRYHTLDGARRKARAHGYSGALYAWESADTGDEVTPKTVVMPDGQQLAILTGEQEQHISADVAYAVWRYWRVTGDDEFMVSAGAEILVETARFWASRARMGGDGHAHIRGVIGPDEYHQTVDDNAYTNTMAIFNLERAAETVMTLNEKGSAEWRRVSSRLALAEEELKTWRTVASKLVTGFDPTTELFEEFAGYFGLEEIDIAALRDCATPIEVWLGPEKTRRSKVVKQADVVALSALLWEDWPQSVHETNFRYYEPRTAHGSSLSPALHALVAARLGDSALAQTYFRQACDIDLANSMGNTADGVHMGALGGLWQAIVFGVAGLRAQEDGILLDPRLLLLGWAEMTFPVQWRGRSLRLRLIADPGRIEVHVKSGGKLKLSVVEGPTCDARHGGRYVLKHQDSGWGAWEAVDQ